MAVVSAAVLCAVALVKHGELPYKASQENDHAVRAKEASIA